MIEEDRISLWIKRFFVCLFVTLSPKIHSLSNKTLEDPGKRKHQRIKLKQLMDIYEIEMSDAKDFQD